MLLDRNLQTKTTDALGGAASTSLGIVCHEHGQRGKAQQHATTTGKAGALVVEALRQPVDHAAGERREKKSEEKRGEVARVCKWGEGTEERFRFSGGKYGGENALTNKQASNQKEGNKRSTKSEMPATSNKVLPHAFCNLNKKMNFLLP